MCSISGMLQSGQGWPGSPLPDRAHGRQSTETKVWTLVPGRRTLVADWFVTEDHASESGLWLHDKFHIAEACGIVGRVLDLTRSTDTRC